MDRQVLPDGREIVVQTLEGESTGIAAMLAMETLEQTGRALLSWGRKITSFGEASKALSEGYPVPLCSKKGRLHRPIARRRREALAFTRMFNVQNDAAEKIASGRPIH